MNPRTAQKLARRILNEAIRPCTVKIGRTNGVPALHIIDPHNPKATEQSTTIFTESDWAAHPLNQLNRPKASEGQDGTLGAEVKVTHV